MLRGSAIGKYPLSFYIGIFASADELEKLPAADVAHVVHAEWRLDGFCTNCGYRADVQRIGFNCTGGTRIESKRTKFCPECGAQMALEVSDGKGYNVRLS